MNFDPETKAVRIKIAELERQHRALDTAIDAMPSFQEFEKMKLKREKLRLKDKISALRAMILPDIIA